MSISAHGAAAQIAAFAPKATSQFVCDVNPRAGECCAITTPDRYDCTGTGANTSCVYVPPVITCVAPGAHPAQAVPTLPTFAVALLITGCALIARRQLKGRS